MSVVDLTAILRELLRIEGQKDSLEIGTPGRGGCVKVYGSFDDPEGFRAKLDIAFELRKLAQVKLAEREGGS